MFNVGGGEIIVLLLLALLLLGPEKLPEAARKVGKVMAEIRRVTSGFEEEVRSAMDIGPAGTVVDLLDRTTSGPTLTGPVAATDASVEAGPDATTGPAPTAPSVQTTRTGTGPAAFVADLGDDAPTVA